MQQRSSFLFCTLKRIFDDSPAKRFADPFDRVQHEEFWDEYLAILGRHGRV